MVKIDELRSNVIGDDESEAAVNVNEAARNGLLLEEETQLPPWRSTPLGRSRTSRSRGSSPSSHDAMHPSH